MKSNNKTSRRNFLKNTASVSAVTTAVVSSVVSPYFFSSEQPVRAEAPSGRVRIGCIGVGSLGRPEATAFSRIADVAAISDVDTSHMEEALAPHEKIGIVRDNKITPPDKIKDYRNILDRKDIDTVCIVTPDHWHVKIAVEALQAGKHVFCQKPLTLTVEEGQLIRNACKKYNRVFQVGTQQRTDFRRHFLNAVILIQKGLIGNIKNILCHIDGSPSCAAIPKAQSPETLDFEKWLGQAPLVDYIATESQHKERQNYWPRNSRTHYEFRWWYEYSGGKFTDWGAHHVDIALWAINQNNAGQGPISFNPISVEHPVPFKEGYPTINNQYNTATKFDIECKFENGIVMNIVSHSKVGNGILFTGEKGRIHVSRGHLNGKPVEDLKGDLSEYIKEEDYIKAYNGQKPEGHKQNFISCIKNGGLPISDVVTHVQAMNVCHLAAIAARLGREIKWDPKNEKAGDKQTQSFIARERRKGYDIPVV
ncbi:MAG: Gfo/Idh/MocA family oxidoreductase [Planctomycetaceae bacterium]|jgi:predicted dehydrogenase|nr:Gfo/Idh/MocA family oxidoreductase [Planctomycetaceae bacterium]